jgi:hypothetical protein
MAAVQAQRDRADFVDGGRQILHVQERFQRQAAPGNHKVAVQRDEEYESFDATEQTHFGDEIEMEIESPVRENTRRKAKGKTRRISSSDDDNVQGPSGMQVNLITS